MRNKNVAARSHETRSLDMSENEFALHAEVVAATSLQHAPALATEAFSWGDVSAGRSPGEYGHEVSLFGVG